MKRTITQKMVEDLKIHHPLRTYFDQGSSEFNRTNYDEKIKTLTKIIDNDYDLHKVIKQYKSNYSMSGYSHVYNNVIPTLGGLISYLTHQDHLDWYFNKDLQSLSESEIIDNLIELIKKNSLKNEKP